MLTEAVNSPDASGCVSTRSSALTSLVEVWFPPLLGAMLLLASILKADSLGGLAAVLAYDGIPSTYAVALASMISYAEAVLGVLLMFNLRSRLLFLGTIALFVCFAGQLVLLSLTKGPSCMCFGRYNWLFGRTSNLAATIQNLSLLTLLIIATRKILFCGGSSDGVVQE
ncbi:MAG: hypothetical protein H7A45_06790 [Verrucomicrobiales bacterium]|nr:hypothetical protein [Verrucomicrobiales bacterium]